MNIFKLHESPILSAQFQCDKHVVKMPLESAQMLCTAHRILDGDDADPSLYKIAHKNHPCTLWTMESIANYHWHYNHWVALCKEYTYRYGKEHLSFTKFSEILKVQPRNIPIGILTPFRLAMGSNPECMFDGDPVKSYREYYKTKKDKFNMVWPKREIPNWFLTSEAA